MIEKAKAFAEKAHGFQKYGQDKPYTYHLGRVFETAQKFCPDRESVLIAAWLHDTVEDTATTLDSIHQEFGDAVADLVYRVTNEPGHNRREKNTKTYPKIRCSLDAVRLKLADRIANVEESFRSRDVMLSMYRKEWPFFREALYRDTDPEDIQQMWKHLQGLLR